MKRLLILTASILIGVLLLGILPVHGEADIYDSVLRLHVIANSDSEYDQQLKLKVRDGVLDAAAVILEGCTTRKEAEAAIAANLDMIKAAAEDVIAAESADFPVTVFFDEEEYPTKNYEGICFPAGTYMSLRVCIGESEGANWWCVLFPKMCFSAAEKKKTEEAFIQAGLTPEQYRIITETQDAKYTIRFKILEIFEKWFGKSNAKQ